MVGGERADVRKALENLNTAPDLTLLPVAAGTDEPEVGLGGVGKAADTKEPEVGLGGVRKAAGSKA